MKFKAYPKIPAFGYDGTDDILDGDVVITPKIDGSNVAVWLTNDSYKAARRNGFLNRDNGSFQVFEDFLEREWKSNVAMQEMASRTDALVIFGEFTNNQNKLKYERKEPIIIFDTAYTTVDEQGDTHLRFNPFDYTQAVAEQLGWPIVPVLFQGPGRDIGNVEQLIESYLNKPSVLGGPNEEGVVVKSYGRTTKYGRNYFCKLVTAEYAESKRVRSKVTKVGSGIGEWAVASYLTPARLEKAIQKMKEEGRWNEETARKNIGPLIGVVTKDIHDEHIAEIEKEAIKAAWKEVGKTVAAAVAPALDELMAKKYSEEEEYWENVIGESENV